MRAMFSVPDIFTKGSLILGLLSITVASCRAISSPTSDGNSSQPIPTRAVASATERTPATPEIHQPTPTLTPHNPIVITPTPSPTPGQMDVQEDQPAAEQIPILEYHETSFTMSGDRVKMTEAWFREQMAWLAENGFITLRAEELLDYVEGNYLPPQRSVVLTFDVGSANADEYENIILPTLREHGFSAIFFVLMNAISEEGEGNTLSWDDLKGWQDEGIISVQSHGVYHPDYKLLTFNQMVWDAGTSSRKIEEELGQKPTIFAFPFDSVPDRNLDLLMERTGYDLGMAGTRLQRSVLPGDADRYSLPRYYPYSNDAAYPKMSDGRGWTFGEMMLASVGAPQPSEVVAEEPTEGPPPMADPYIPPSLDDLLSYCALSIPDKIYGLDQFAAFPTDISSCTRRILPGEVVVKPTCNFETAIIPEAIVLHFTYGPYSSTVNEFRESELESSAHYIVDRDGSVTQMVPEILSANHVTCYGNRELCVPECPICDDDQGRLSEPKFRSIGIELVNVGRLRGEPGDFHNPDGSTFSGLVYEDDLRSWGYRYWEDYPEAQITSLRMLLIDIMQRWHIPLERVIGHDQVQVNKIDPGPALNLTGDRSGDPWRGAIFGPDFSLPEMGCAEQRFPKTYPLLLD